MRRAVAVVVALLGVPACGGDEGGTGGFCDAIKELESRGSLGTDVGVGTDPAEVLALYSANQEILVRLRETAPGEIRVDATRLADAHGQAVAALERNDADLARAGQEVAVLLDDPETDAAFDRIVAYAAEKCDL